MQRGLKELQMMKVGYHATSVPRSSFSGDVDALQAVTNRGLLDVECTQAHGFGIETNSSQPVLPTRPTGG